MGSIKDISLYTWDRILEGEKHLLRINPDIGNDSIDEKALKLLEEQIMTNFGIGDDTKRYVETQLELYAYEMDYITTKDPFYITEIEIKTIELNEMINDFNSREKGTFEGNLLVMSKELGYKLSMRDVTVFEYYEMIRMNNKKAKQNG